MGATERRARYRKIANRCRAIPGQHGLRPWRVFTYVGAWSGTDHFGDGTRTDTETELLENGQPPRVRQVSPERVALGVGLEGGDLEIGPVTPIVGTAWADLNGGSTDANESFRVRLSNEETGAVLHCVLVTVRTDKALHTTLTVRPVRSNG